MVKPRRVLIVKLSSLGDVIHTLPVVQDLRKAWPDAQIDWVVEPGFAPLVRRAAGIGRVIECAQRRWRKKGVAGWFDGDTRAQKLAFRTALQEQAYDLVLDLQGLTKSALVSRQARLTPTGQRVAIANRSDGSSHEAPTRWVADLAVTVPARIHALDRARFVAARAIGAEQPPAGPPDFGLRAPAAAALPESRPCVVFIHGTSRDDKLWPQAHWVELGRRCVEAGWRIALPQGSAEEGARAERLAQAIGTAHAAVWPLQSLDALLDQMAATQGAIGVDSGLSHLAVALDLPHVQLYNFPTAWRTGPLAAHGHRHQCAIEGVVAGGLASPLAPPGVEAVWLAWSAVLAARHPSAGDANAAAANNLETDSDTDSANANANANAATTTTTATATATAAAAAAAAAPAQAGVRAEAGADPFPRSIADSARDAAATPGAAASLPIPR